MRSLNISQTAQQLVAFIKTTVSTAGFTDVVIAVSGGVDSAVSTALAVQALGVEHVHALLLPYKNLYPDAIERAHELLNQLAVSSNHQQIIEIAPIVDGLQSVVALSAELSDAEKARLGNAMARARMMVLFDTAKKLPALVLGTENKSEHYLGYFTRFGDEASDIEPLRNLYKTEVYELGAFLGVPERILKATPTAGLWPEQTDEGELGFTYRNADAVLYGLFDQKKSIDALIAEGLDPAVVHQVAKWCEKVSFKLLLPHLAPEPMLL